MMVAPVRTTPDLSVSEPRVLFEFAGGFVPGGDIGSTYAVAPDGRFLFLQGKGQSTRASELAVTNWFDEIKRLTDQPGR
jgi:hypothetical protein